MNHAKKSPERVKEKPQNNRLFLNSTTLPLKYKRKSDCNMKTNLKKIQAFKFLLVIVILTIIGAGVFWVEEFYLWEKRAETSYVNAKNRLLENWQVNKEKLLDLGELIKASSSIYEFNISIDNELECLIGVNCYEDKCTILSISEIEEYFSIAYLDTCFLESEYECLRFGEQNKDQLFDIVYRKLQISHSDLITLKELVKDVNCIGFWRDRDNPDAINIQYEGNNFYGSFNYQFDLDSDSVYREREKLGDGVYYYYESGLWCGKPIFLDPSWKN